MADLTRFLAPGDARQSEDENAPARDCHPGQGLHDPTTNQEAGTAMSTIIPIPSSALIGDLPRIDRPCSVWCSSSEGHPWESVTLEGMVSRVHEQTISPSGEFASVTVCTEETARAVPCEHDSPERVGAARCLCVHRAEGPSSFTPVLVCAYVDVDEFNPQQATQLAIWLRTAGIAANRYATATFAPVVTR